MSEIEEIKRRYAARADNKELTPLYSPHSLFHIYARNEREFLVSQWLPRYLDFSRQPFALEVGAGLGDNLLMLKRLGFAWENIYANELLSPRVKELQRLLPSGQVFPGDITAVNPQKKFSLILQFLVFSSILDDKFKQQVADKMVELLAPQGLLLWYDFAVDNPYNQHVRGVSLRRVKELFPTLELVEKAWVTMAPPIGRRLGRLYPLVNAVLPFLRTHRLYLLRKASDQ